MTKLISALIIIVAIFCGWQLFKYYERIEDEEKIKKKEAAEQLNPANMAGLPSPLEPSLQKAQEQGAIAFRNWYKAQEKNLQDPRKAWIELDLCVALTREDPTEARRLFKGVKDRLPVNSPLQARLKQLQAAYE